MPAMVTLWLTLIPAALPTTPFQPELQLEPGQTFVVETPVRLPRRARSAVARVRVRTHPAGIEVLDTTELALAGAASRLGYAVSAGPGAEGGLLIFDVEVRTRRRRLKAFRIRHQIEVTDPSATEDDLRQLRADLEGSRWPPSPPEEISGPLAEDPRLVQWASFRRLRTLAARTEPMGGSAYWVLSRANEARPETQALAPPSTLEETLEAIGGFRPVAAGRAVARLRERSDLKPPRLATLLELQGCLRTSEAQSSLARQSWIQALSLAPKLNPICPIPMGRHQFRELRTRLAPERPLRVGRIRLEPTKDPERGLDIAVEVAPDPGRLGRSVRLKIQPSREPNPIPATGELQHLQQTGTARLFVATDVGSDQQIPVRVRVEDEFGNVIAEAGRPDPLYVPLPRGDKKAPVPSWVWWLAGGLVVAGAATAGIVVAATNQPADRPDPNLGPVDIRF